jgi:hypothetical protein
MSKRNDEANKLDALVQTLFPDDATVSDQEVSAFLDAMKSDVEGLRARLIAVTRGFAAAERREQRAAPPHLRGVVESLENSGSLPRNPAAAASRAKEWLTGLMQTGSFPDTLRVVEAYRKSDADLTEADKKALDRLADELRGEIEDDGKGR